MKSPTVSVPGSGRWTVPSPGQFGGLSPPRVRSVDRPFPGSGRRTVPVPGSGRWTVPSPGQVGGPSPPRVRLVDRPLPGSGRRPVPSPGQVGGQSPGSERCRAGRAGPCVGGDERPGSGRILASVALMAAVESRRHASRRHSTPQVSVTLP